MIEGELIIAVLGLGSIGRRHARNLAAIGCKALGFDPDPACRRAVEEELGLETVASLDALWHREPEAVLVAAPTTRHLELATLAVDHRVHLFVEKPLADRLDGIDKLVEGAESAGLVTLVGCNVRFHPGMRALCSLLRDGEIGRPIALQAEYGHYLPDWRPGRDYRATYSARREEGGGIILDAIHELDYARWLMGPIAQVACFADHLSELEIDVEDTASILLRFRSGALAELHLDFVQRRYVRRCRIVGLDGIAGWDWHQGLTVLNSTDGGEARRFEPPNGWEPNDMYVDELRHFIACLRGEAEPEQDLRAGTEAVRIALAAREASEGQRVVRLASDDIAAS